MTRFGIRACIFLSCRLVLVFGLLVQSHADEPSKGGPGGGEPTEGEKLFVLAVAPLFEAKCAGCHAEADDSIEGGFDLRSRSAAIAGGDQFGGTVIVPGDSMASELMPLLRREIGGMEMPPKESEALTEEEVWAVRDWIDAGAPWPNKQRSAQIYRDHAQGVTVTTSGGLGPAWTNRKYDPSDLWAFQSIQRQFPVLDSDTGNRNPIDVFIDQRITELGLTAAPAADRRNLIRRATFDLHGLPPTPEQVAEFLADRRDDRQAFESLIDRLLESPHYGEQWGRRWLDVVRYSDSSGFANDWERPNAWRYRDYVVRAINQDKPFDELILEQIAGDEWIEQAEAAGRTIDDQERTEKQIAAGFLRMGPWEHTSMSVARVTRQLFLDDITDTVGQVFLGQPLQCCRCHDHKFDPIPTRDFYSIQAAFATTQFAEVDSAWLDSENRSMMDVDRKYHMMRREEANRMLQAVHATRSARQAEWFRENGLPYKTIQEAKKAGASQDELPPATIMTPQEFGIERIARKWVARFNWETDRYRPITFTVYNGKTRPRGNMSERLVRPTDPMDKGVLEKSTILTGGDPFSPGEPVSPGVLSAVPGALDVSLPETPSGRRLALARWIADPENSLTSRVIANRLWSGHFSRGIAGNPNNFGATGKKPTHPELLDWLATEMTQSGWSFKHMHRIIMNSQAYQRSTRHPDPESITKADPAGESYAVFRPRRLEAEEVRDAMLAVAGTLNLEVGGIPVRPDMNLEAALQPRLIMGTFAPAYVPHPQPEHRNRRSIYIHNLRGHRLPFMETFNQPGSEVSCELRDASNITPQVFTLFNGQETNDRALELAIRASKESDDPRKTIMRLFQLAFARDAEPSEIDSALDHWRRMESLQSELAFQPTEFPTQVEREAVDENTGEPFTFTEKLFAYKDYTPDVQPHQVDARTRALADVCLAILNSNEFIYVY